MIFDPGGDCAIDGAGTRLEITVPGTLHDLSVEHGQISAPRVLISVTGDFVAQVTVAAGCSPRGKPTSSVEGRDWVPCPRTVGIRGWGESLQVGVAAVNTSSAPLTAELRGLRISHDAQPAS